MQSITKKALAGLGVIVVLLLALGALPGFLKSGDPYYFTAEPANVTGDFANTTLAEENATLADGKLSLADENATIPEAANLSDRTYRYTWQALRNVAASEDGVGRSSPYWKGFVGFKEAFTHSPFDEIGSYRTLYPGAIVDENAVLVRYENQTYRLAVTGG